MRFAQLVVALYVAGGAIAFSVWSVKVYATSALARDEKGRVKDRTTAAVYYAGSILIWAAIVVIGGGLAGAAAMSVARAIGGL